MVIRLYLSVLTFVYFVSALHRGLELLEAIVVICALLYLILDTREHLKLLKARVRTLKQLEEELLIQPRA